MPLNKKSEFISIIFGLLLAEIVFFTCLSINAFNIDFYNNKHNFNINNQQAQKDTLKILNMIRGKENKAHDIALLNNEYTHLLDVKNLYYNFRFISIISFLVAIGILFFLMIKKRFLELSSGIFISLTIIIILVFFIFLLSNNNFSKFWFSFHEIIFRNDLWLLNSDDYLILLFPSSLFSSLVKNIIIEFGLSLLIIYIANLLLFKKIYFSK